jgi:hypothetical protein
MDSPLWSFPSDQMQELDSQVEVYNCGHWMGQATFPAYKPFHACRASVRCYASDKRIPAITCHSSWYRGSLLAVLLLSPILRSVLAPVAALIAPAGCWTHSFPSPAPGLITSCYVVFRLATWWSGAQHQICLALLICSLRVDVSLELAMPLRPQTSLAYFVWLSLAFRGLHKTRLLRCLSRPGDAYSLKWQESMSVASM